MAVKVVKGQELDLTYRLTDDLGDPLDLSLYETIEVCIADPTPIHKKRLLRTGNWNGSTAVITNTDTSYCEVGDVVSGTGIAPGSKILTVDSATQFTLTLNTTSPQTGGALVIGNGIVVAGATQIGKFKISLLESETSGLTVQSTNSEVILVKSGVTSIVLFNATLNVLAAYC